MKVARVWERSDSRLIGRLPVCEGPAYTNIHSGPRVLYEKSSPGLCPHSQELGFTPHYAVSISSASSYDECTRLFTHIRRRNHFPGRDHPLDILLHVQPRPLLLGKVQSTPWVSHTGDHKAVLCPYRASIKGAISTLRRRTRAHVHDVRERLVELDQPIIPLKINRQEGIPMLLQGFYNRPCTMQTISPVLRGE